MAGEDFIVSLLAYDASTGEDLDSADASESAIAGVLRRLDGRSVDNILVEIHLPDEVVEAGLSDGRNGWCCLYVADRSGSFYLCGLSPPPLAQRELTMTICGQQESDQWTHWVVPTADAIDALWYLIRTGKRDPGRTWELLDHATFDSSGPHRPWPTAAPPKAPSDTIDHL
jgi:hypothetical protein